MESHQHVMFSLPFSAHQALYKQALVHGFKTVPAYCRWLCEKASGVGVQWTNTYDGRTPLLTATEFSVLSSLTEKPDTVRGLACSINRSANFIALTIRVLTDKGLIQKQNEVKWTGGRPAFIFTLTEGGRFRLGQEQTRRQQSTERSEQEHKALCMASARAYPDFKIKRTLHIEADMSDPMMAYTAAALKALYDWCDKYEKDLSPEDVQKRVEEQLASALYDEGLTYDTERVKLEAEGWPETPEATDKRGNLL